MGTDLCKTSPLSKLLASTLPLISKYSLKFACPCPPSLSLLKIQTLFADLKDLFQGAKEFNKPASA
jgi:hypothetical protein